ncbi:MAG: rRNA maturation RNase YbeY [Leptospiraceae bacterium]|nr:rRNA maturation RNase YbeY [Leptospiraceae bacterium]
MAVEFLCHAPWDIPALDPDRVGQLLDLALAHHCRLDGMANVFRWQLVWTDQHLIRRFNQQTRGVDKATDVLSFPLIHFPPGPGSAVLAEADAGDDLPDTPGPGVAWRDLRRPPNADQSPDNRNTDAGTALLELGEVYICRELCFAQAQQIGHTAAAEFWRLAVHGLLHLFGYDHETSAADEKRMQLREDELWGLLVAQL